MEINNIKTVYFIGAGGIGMSALVRYFLHLGKKIGGYDKTPSELTQKLIEEGAKIHFEDNVSLIGDEFKNRSNTLVVYTPAIPKNNTELSFFKNNGFTLKKRSEVLGIITKSLKALCVAGTHGKTTTSTILSHILHESTIGCNAFLGGVSHNYQSNLLVDTNSPYAVIEADEFDRSFHHLHPYLSIITSADPDHLDIYGSADEYKKSFEHYITLISGVLILKEGVQLDLNLQEGVQLYSYSLDKGDFHAENINSQDGDIHFDFISKSVQIRNIKLGVPLKINIENSVAAIAAALMIGVTPSEIKNAIASFRGIERRFDIVLKNKNNALISDYAHHPVEIKKSIESVQMLYPHLPITVIFQPHLYTRTRDFYKEFASSLSLADTCILLDIYPARELPIEGVNSDLIFNEIDKRCTKYLSNKENLCNLIKELKPSIVLTLGAGDINLLLPEIKDVVSNMWINNVQKDI